MRKISLLFISLFLIVAVNSASIVVTTQNDSGAGSLRDAITNASPGDVITFDPGVTSISLLSGLNIINENLTIEGGDGVTLQGNDNNAVVYIEGNTLSQMSVELNNLKITGGNTTSFGGGLIIRGNVKIDFNACEISGNKADKATSANAGAGLYIDSTYTPGIPHPEVTFNKCRIINNTAVPTVAANGRGAGIYINVGTLNLTECTVSGNIAKTPGGGIYNKSGSLSIQQSTIANNSATSGGGIYVESTAVLSDFRQNTIINNQAITGGGAGLFINGGAASIYNNTIMGNSAGSYAGGVFNAGTLQLGANIITGNKATTNPGTSDLLAGGSVTDNGYNILIAGTNNLPANPKNEIITFSNLSVLFSGISGTGVFIPTAVLVRGGSIEAVVPNQTGLDYLLIVPYSMNFLNGETTDQRGNTIYPDEDGFYCAGAVNILKPTSITNQLINSTALCAGNDYLFSVTAEGCNLSYQWYHNGVAVEDATLPAFTLDGLTPDDGGEYTVVVTGNTEAGITEVPGQTAELTILTAPVIVSGPQPVSICQGSDYLISAGIIGSGLQYQWYLDDVAIDNATNAEYAILNAAKDKDYGDYKVSVSGVCNPAVLTSSNARIWVADSIVKPILLDIPDVAYTGKSTRLHVGNDFGYADVTRYSWGFSNPNSDAYATEEQTVFVTFDNVTDKQTVTITMDHVCGPYVVSKDIKVELPTNIDNTLSSEVNVFPNPVADVLQITCKDSELVNIQITDVNGRVIYQSSPNVIDYSLPVTNWNPGVYFVKVTTGSGSIVHKIVKN